MIKRALVVDDIAEYTARWKAAIIAKYPKTVVDTAANYHDAKSCLLKHDYDVVLTDMCYPRTKDDIQLPDINSGEKLIMDLRCSLFSNNPSVPIVLISDAVAPSERARILIPRLCGRPNPIVHLGKAELNGGKGVAGADKVINAIESVMSKKARSL